MAHVLLIELPGGDDTDILDTAVALGHQVSFLTGDLATYQRRAAVPPSLARSRALLEVKPFDYATVEREVLALHFVHPIDAVLCLVDIRMVAAARIAARLGLPFLNVASATLLRDKFSVRQRLHERGIAQPAFALATSNAGLRAAVSALGLPALVKPSDGYGSQNVVVLRDEDDLQPWMTPLDDFLPQHLDYGLGVQANDRLLVEAYMAGPVIGCDTYTFAGQHRLIALNDKQFFPLPSFAIRGSCVPCEETGGESLRDYVFAVLDAVGFNHGIAHTELVLTADGPRLIEVNPRLVGARIARLLNLAFDRSVHRDLIDLHLGLPLQSEFRAAHFAVSRWFVGAEAGRLQQVSLPSSCHPAIRHVDVVKQVGDHVRPPCDNGDRVGYVMTCTDDRASAEALAEQFVQNVHLDIAS